MADVGEELFYLKDDEIELPSEDGNSYREGMFEGEDDDTLSGDGDEDLDTLVANVAMSKALDTPSHDLSEPTEIPHSISGGEVIEDFVRNFLMKMGLHQTLHRFQAEWYELLVAGKLEQQHEQTVPDVYTQNQIIVSQMESLKSELKGYKEAAQVAKEKYVRLKKERDFHRMHHRRTVQEKEKLITEIKRMKDHFSTYEPMLSGLKTKYESATRDKILTKLERDKAMAELECLQSTLHSLRPSSYPPPTTKRPLVSSRSQPLPPITSKQQQPQENALPNKLHSLPQDPANPYRTGGHPLCAHLSRVGGFQLTGTINAHKYPVSCMSLHPTKNILATGSDDHTWRVWAVPSGELLMTGEGHEDWVSDVQFHPSGDLLASCSGDGVVKIWNFTKLSTVVTLEDHRQPVWGCGWHWSGGVIASCGMDHTCRLWDIESVKCLLTLRGHADSVNAVRFVPFSNTLATCSADKTVSLWDIRTGLCTQTLYGHENACNDVVSNWQSTELYSADCFGFVKCWDIRGKGPCNQWDIGPHPTSGLNIDIAGSVLACASGSGHVFMIQLDPEHLSQLECTGGSVEAVTYGHNSDMLFSVGADGKISVWQ